MTVYTVRNLHSRELENWSLKEVLHEINRDRSDEWTSYNETDWKEGWACHAEGDTFTMISPVIPAKGWGR